MRFRRSKPRPTPENSGILTEFGRQKNQIEKDLKDLDEIMERPSRRETHFWSVYGRVRSFYYYPPKFAPGESLYYENLRASANFLIQKIEGIKGKLEMRKIPLNFARGNLFKIFSILHSANTRERILEMISDVQREG